VKDTILSHLEALKKEDLDLLMQKRFEKFRQMGNITLTIDNSEESKA